MSGLIIQRLRVSGLLVTVVGILSLASAAPVPTHLFPKGQSAIFPVKIGTQWVYDTPQGTETRIVTKSEKSDEFDIISIGLIDKNGALSPCQKMSVGAKGVHLIEGSSFFFMQRNGRYQRPWRLFEADIKPDDKWDANIILEGGVILTGTMRVVRTELVKVSAGTYNATRIDWEYSVDSGPKKETIPYWYAAGVGLIQVGDPPILALKSFTPGK